MKKIFIAFIFLLIASPAFAQAVQNPNCPVGWALTSVPDAPQPDTTIQRSFNCSVTETLAQYNNNLASLQKQVTLVAKQSSTLSAEVAAMQAIASQASQAQPVGAR